MLMRGGAQAGAHLLRRSQEVAKVATPRSTTTKSSSDNAGQTQVPRVFPKYAIYKGKAAVQLKIIAPTLVATTKGNNFLVEREGVLFLEFASLAAGAGGTGFGERSYDWTQKITFAMKATEIGMLLADDGKGFSLFHDPDKGTANEGTQKKSVKLAPSPDGGYFLSASMTSSGMQRNASVPIAKNEMAVIKSLANWAVPRLLGFDMQFEGAMSTGGGGDASEQN